MSVITATSFDASKLTTSDIKRLDNGSSQVYINYDGKRLRVQAPQVVVPYNSGDYNDNKKYKTSISFKGMDRNPKLKKHYEMLEAVDRFVIDVATANAGKWFKMPGASRDLIAAFYTPTLKFSKDKEGNVKDLPPTQALKLGQRNGAFDTELYDDKSRVMEGVDALEVLCRNAEIVPICDATGIWIGDKKFGVTWKLHQARVVVPGDGGSARGFLGVTDEDDVRAAGISVEEERDLLSSVMPSASVAAPAAAVAAAADEDDEEEEEEDESDVIPAPPVPAPKKIVVTPPPVAAAPAPAVKKVVKKVAKA